MFTNLLNLFKFGDDAIVDVLKIDDNMDKIDAGVETNKNAIQNNTEQIENLNFGTIDELKQSTTAKVGDRIVVRGHYNLDDTCGRDGVIVDNSETWDIELNNGLKFRTLKLHNENIFLKRLKQGEKAIVAHRCLQATNPENTIGAFHDAESCRKAFGMMKAVEIDLQVTSDNKIILFHGPAGSGNNIPDGTNIADYTYQGLIDNYYYTFASDRIGGNTAEYSPKTTFPLFSDFAKEFAKSGMDLVMLELKVPFTEAAKTEFFKIIKDNNLDGRVGIFSEYITHEEQISELPNSCYIKLTGSGKWETDHQMMKEYGNSIMVFTVSDHFDNIEDSVKWQQMYDTVYSTYQSDDTAELRELLENNVLLPMTDINTGGAL